MDRIRIRHAAAVFALSSMAASSAANAGAGDGDPYTAALGALINDYREQHHLARIQFAAPLSALADEHSKRMAKESRMSHDGFQQRFEKARSRTCVENVAWNQRTPKAAFEGWRNSAVHNRNMLNREIAQMGLAIERGYLTFFACA